MSNQEDLERSLISDPYKNPFETQVEESIYQPIQANDYAFALRGKLFLVVGPAGSGKSTLLHRAKKIIGNDEKYAFPKRYIVKSKTKDDDEDFFDITKMVFARMQRDNEFIFSWSSAHGVDYGILAKDVDDALSKQKNVILQVSRPVIESALEKYGNTNRITVIEVTADKNTLHQRLKNKGLNDSQLKEKDRRNNQFEDYAKKHIDPQHHKIIQNNGSIDRGLDQLLVALLFKTAPTEVIASNEVEEEKDSSKIVAESIPAADADLIVNENVVLESSIHEDVSKSVLDQTTKEFFQDTTMIRDFIHQKAEKSDSEHKQAERRVIKETTTVVKPQQPGAAPVETRTTTTTVVNNAGGAPVVTTSVKKTVKKESGWGFGKILAVGGLVAGGIFAVRYFIQHTGFFKKK